MGFIGEGLDVAFQAMVFMIQMVVKVFKMVYSWQKAADARRDGWNGDGTEVEDV